MPVVALGLSHRTSPVSLRERLAFSEASIPPSLDKLRADGLADEAVILSTCNRVEIYVATQKEGPTALPQIRQFLLDSHNFRDPVNSEIYAFDEPQSLEHLFKVACGLDSMVLGETEILGQMKKAYDLALQHQHTGKRLNKAFQKAFNVAKQVRTETAIQRGNVSVGSVAVELAEKIFSTLTDRTVMVIGAGDTSEKTARSLVSRGAKNVLVTNRSYDRAQALATELGGRAVPFDDWAQDFVSIDIIISSTSAPNYVIDRPKLEPLLKFRKHRPLLLVDIAVPRDIDPEVNLLEGVYLYNVDDLQSIAQDGMRQRQEEIARCESIIREKVKGLLSGAAQGLMQGSRLVFGS